MTGEQIWEQALHVWSAESESVGKLKNIIDRNTFESLVRAIAECKRNKGRVLTTGVGTSGAAAKKIAHTFSCVEIPSFFLSPADGVHGALGALQKEDMLIAISKGGGTEEILKVIPAVKAKGARLVGVTENENSVLARESCIFVRVKVNREPDPFNMLATASTMAVVAVFDAAAIVLMHLTDYRKEQFAVIHPGGAVGERLLQTKESED